ncbi:MAG: acylphosphatase [Chitinophagaceae bacterium]|nr:acylphosphatase [Chitinophagaceae bacterium]
MSSEHLHTRIILITGKVQGVYFRQSACKTADECGCTGEVCNLPDGSVKIIATGTRFQLDEFAEWCKSGPPRARVVTVTVTETTLQQYKEFRIVR